MPELFDILTYDYNIVENIPITTTTPDWTDVITLTTPERAAGTYGLAFSLQFNMASTTKSFMYRFSLDGGSTWGNTYYKEAKDKPDIQIIEVLSILELAAPAIIDVRCQCTREAAATCDVLKAILACERKA
jgi:hypothetical protein